jgi:uncharacterized NAD(P)/FAD-binding protein YdhS
VTAIKRRGRDLSLRLSLDDGFELYGDAVVLAVGNPPPTQLPLADALHGHPAYVGDPWTMPAPTGAGERVFLIGTGLTMIDVVLATAARASGGVFHALSRHGLVGYRQTSFRPDAFRGSGEAVMLAAASSPRWLLRAVRSLARDAEAAGGDWREAINFVRGVAPNLWQRMSIADRARFLRHVRPYWDVHRHRLPEAALARITHLMHTGRLHVHAGRLEALELVRDGLAVPDPLGLGLRTGVHGAVIDADGWPGTNFPYLGPMLRADHWETTSASELAVHAARLAVHLS